jgi:signal transduction histidine kinase/DNA-binding response OmpR family regulator/HPt (histidine-containing phosphotransfer) domain-containing protein
MIRWFDNLPLTAKLRAGMLAAAAAALVVGAVLQIAGELIWARRGLAAQLLTTATTLGESTSAALAAADTTLARNVLGTLRADPNIRAATLYDSTGRLFVDVPLSVDASTPERRLQAWSIGNAIRSDQSIRFRGLTLVHVQAPILLNGELVGSIHLDADLAQLNSQLWSSLAILGLAMLAAAIAARAASARLTMSIKRPLNELLAVARQARENKSFTGRGTKHADDEIGALTDALNHLLAELEKRDRSLLVYQNELETRVRGRTSRLDSAVADAHEALERAEAASRAKSEFLARMSHEIRTPMNAVLGMTELLRYSTTLDDRQRRYTDTIHQSGSALLGIINDILDFSKIEAGKLDLDIAPFSLRQVVEDAVEVLAERAQSKGLELLCDIPPDVETAVCGDAQRLRQIIINLVGNAVKFTERGEVKIVVGHTGTDRAHTKFHFEVSDSGVGIHPENCASIFDSFAQEDNSTTRKYGGTGLGLAICKQLVELMGGQIGVRSSPGIGSTFFFTVVLANDPATVRGMRPVVLKGARVLIVDDNATNRGIVAGHLKSWGVEATEASSALLALEILRADERVPFDAIAIDVHMPEMDGFALAAEIRRRPLLADVPLLLMRSIAADPAADTELTGRTAWLSKPVRRSQLHACLASLLTEEPAAAGADRVAPKKPAAVTREPREMSRIRKVLLVEDNPVNQELALAMLAELGVEVVSAWTGEEALIKLAADSFEAVLMDCQMPRLDGYATTRRLREWERRTGRDRTPVIALTANALNGDAARCFEAGMDRYLSKPFTVDQLYRILDSCAPAEAAMPEGAAAPAEAAAPARAAAPAEGAAPTRAAAPAETAAPARAATPANSGAPAAQTAEAASLDKQTIDRIRDLQRPGAPNLISKLAGLYESSSLALLEKARAALESKDADGLAHAAHALKSSSGNIGAILLADLCANLEAAARSAVLQDAEMLLHRIVAEHAAVVKNLGAQSAAARGIQAA